MTVFNPRRAFVALPVLLALVALIFALPYPELRTFRNRAESVRLTDRNGRLLQVIPLENGLRREFTPLADIPSFAVDIFMRSEDGRFYLHPGVDPAATVRAAAQLLRSGSIQSGASTISMQLARIVSPEASAREAGVAGKLNEMRNALRIEAHLSKKRILELWLNAIPFGFNAEGITSATRTFFGHDLATLTPAEALLLAVVPRSPKDFNPIDEPEAAAEEAYALSLRLGAGVTREELLETAGTAAAASRDAYPFLAPHFSAEVANLLASQDTALRAAQVKTNGTVTTSMDYELQEAFEASIRARVIGAAANRISNGAGIIIDNATGEILSWVGSVDFHDEEHSGQIDGVLIERQPGSTMKPFLYGLALEHGFTPATVLPDIPSQFGGEEIYIPENFNRRFNGPVRLRTALASSLNVPAVYTLERIGVGNFVEQMLDNGFVSLEEEKDSVGTGLALGNAGVTLYELARAFSAFPRGGVALPLRWAAAGRPASGDQTDMRPRLPEFIGWPAGRDPGTGRQVYTPTAAGLIRDILSDRVGRVTGFGTRSVLNTPFQAMFKTGTSNQFNNIWALGATARFTVGVWMGNFSGSTVIGRPGSSLPAAVVVEMLSMLSRANETLPAVPGVHPVEICALSGMRATRYCTATLEEYFPEGVDPAPCTWHVGEGLPPRYPAEFQTWARDRAYLSLGPGLLLRDSAGAFASNGTAVRISHPSDRALFYYDPTVPAHDQAVRIEAVSDASTPLSIYVNDAFFGSGPSPLVAYVPLERGVFNVTAVQDEVGGASDSVTFTVR